MPTPEDDTQGQPQQGRLIANRYRLGTKLGGGAMGMVWSGTDELLRRPVAVKEVRMPENIPEDEAAELRERTLREARATAVITHPNVVTLYDVARENGEPFVVMELVPSRSLSSLLSKHGALDDAQLALVADAVASALDAAHRSGIVHRDIKPGNVLVADDGRIKLSDFGIARNIAEQTLTRAGIMLGTPAFISPEVAEGDPVTSTVDLWGLGATLFAAAEGHAPYDADDDPVATIASIVRGPVPRVSRTGPIAEVISGLMVKAPSGRLSLETVRRRVRELLPEAGVRPFDTLVNPAAPSGRSAHTKDSLLPGSLAFASRGSGPHATVRPARASPVSQAGGSPGAPQSGAPRLDASRSGASQSDSSQSGTYQSAAPLAAVPGPLPFMPREPAHPPRRSPWSPWPLTALGIATVFVFAAATLAGFAASRDLAGQPILPPSPGAAPLEPRAPRLVPRVESAQYGSSPRGTFTVPVPAGWETFRGERDEKPTYSRAVYFISPDARGELVVERFGDYFAEGYTTEDYLSRLPNLAAGTRGRFQLLADVPGAVTGASSGQPDRRLRYDTVEHAIAFPAGKPLHQRTAAALLARNGDLWVVRATVPIGEAPRADALLNRVEPGFAPH